MVDLNLSIIEKFFDAYSRHDINEVQNDTGINLNQHMCVLWIFKGGKIVEGKHLTSNTTEVDAFFNEVG